jgi:uncharacterized protein (DUF885 family)
MNKLLVGLACIACIVLGSVPALAAAVDAAGTRADNAFKALYTREWNWRQAQRGADEDGPGSASAHLPRVDAASQAAREKYWADVLDELKRIPVGQLSDAEKVNYQIYEYQIRTLLASQRFREWQMPFNADTAYWTNLGFSARAHYASAREYRDYLSRLRDVPRYFADEEANMRLGLKRGFSQPPLVVKGIEPSITSVADAHGEDNLFYAPFKDMPATIPADQQAALRAEALQVIRDDVVPAYAKLLDFMRNVYLKQARTTLAAYDLPDGKAYYQSRIQEFTTLDLSPAQIHQIGIDEMADIHQQMLDTIKRTGFKGSYSEFLQFLRTDPQFYAKTPKELLEHTAWIAKQIDGKIGNYIGHMPRARFGIRPVPADLAPFYTGGRGGMGVCLFNTYNLPVRKLYSIPALVLHECEPGHSTQMPLAAELTGLPDFRRYSYISAYGEGWALYCEYLGVEMGMYETPYEHFGYLSYQAWRAARLVVDTGLHAMHWTRQQAVDYMRENTALADHEIQTEVNRYIAWPGQALSYYLGERDIRQQRARAEKALGDKFDLRNFHDAVLSTGSVPLPVLDARIDRFIAEGGKSPYARQ